MEDSKGKQKKVQEAYETAAIRFGEDPKKTPNEEFFDLVKVNTDFGSIGWIGWIGLITENNALPTVSVCQGLTLWKYVLRS